MSDLNYINARVRGKRARLLKPYQFDELINLESPDEMVSFLRTTGFEPVLERILLREDEMFTAIDETLKTNLTDEVVSLYRGDDIIKNGLAVYLSSFDLLNLKTIIRSIVKGAKVTSSDMLCLGSLKRRTIDELIRTNDLRLIASYLRTFGSPFGRALSEGLKKFDEDKDLSNLEISLDRFYFDYVNEATGSLRSSALRKTLKGIFSFKIDFINILNLFKIFNEGKDLVNDKGYCLELFVHGGKYIDKKKFIKALSIIFVNVDSSNNEDSLVNFLNFTVKDRSFRDFFIKSNVDMSLLTEENFNKYLRDKLYTQSLLNPTGFEFLLYFVELKICEYKNLKLKLNSFHYSFDKRELRGYMFDLKGIN